MNIFTRENSTAYGRNKMCKANKKNSLGHINLLCAIIKAACHDFTKWPQMANKKDAATEPRITHNFENIFFSHRRVGEMTST